MAIIKNKQSIFDLSVQLYGGVEGLFILIEENPKSFAIGIMSQPSVGSTIIAKSIINAQKRAIVDYYAVNKIEPATDISELTYGIGQMIIQTTFKVY